MVFLHPSDHCYTSGEYLVRHSQCMADITRQIETELIFISDEEQCMFFIIFYGFLCEKQ